MIINKMFRKIANAIFIKDANRLITEDPLDAYLEARKRDALIFWNHPCYQGFFTQN